MPARGYAVVRGREIAAIAHCFSPPPMPNPDLTFVRLWQLGGERDLFSACLLRCPMPLVTEVRVSNVLSSQIVTAK